MADEQYDVFETGALSHTKHDRGLERTVMNGIVPGMA